MKVTKGYLKKLIKEELKSINEQQDGFEMFMDLGTILQGNAIRVNVSESDTDSRKIRINSINVEDAMEFVNAVAKEAPFEVDMKKMDRDEINEFEKGLEGQRRSAWDDYAADRAADKADRERDDF